MTAQAKTPKAAATATALVPDDAVSPTPRAFPDARLDDSATAQARDLNVGSPWEALMRLEQRPDLQQVAWVTRDDRMRIPDVDGDEADALDLLRRSRDGYVVAEILLDPAFVLGSSLATTSRAPTRTVTCVAPVSSASHRAAMRVPLPDISACDPSGFQITISSASSRRPMTSSTPSAPLTPARTDSGV